MKQSEKNQEKMNTIEAKLDVMISKIEELADENKRFRKFIKESKDAFMYDCIICNKVWPQFANEEVSGVLPCEFCLNAVCFQCAQDKKVSPCTKCSHWICSECESKYSDKKLNPETGNHDEWCSQ
jgi:hypothetical protein